MLRRSCLLLSGSWRESDLSLAGEGGEPDTGHAGVIDFFDRQISLRSFGPGCGPFASLLPETTNLAGLQSAERLRH
jgi:hypothetical protein